jgi:hypothetical protein
MTGNKKRGRFMKQCRNRYFIRICAQKSKLQSFFAFNRRKSTNEALWQLVASLIGPKTISSGLCECLIYAVYLHNIVVGCRNLILESKCPSIDRGEMHLPRLF